MYEVVYQSDFGHEEAGLRGFQGLAKLTLLRGSRARS